MFETQTCNYKATTFKWHLYKPTMVWICIFFRGFADESADPNEEVKQENGQEAVALIETFMA